MGDSVEDRPLNSMQPERLIDNKIVVYPIFRGCTVRADER
jgi:hypothetical protein